MFVKWEKKEEETFVGYDSRICSEKQLESFSCPFYRSLKKWSTYLDIEATGSLKKQGQNGLDFPFFWALPDKL